MIHFMATFVFPVTPEKISFKRNISFFLFGCHQTYSTAHFIHQCLECDTIFREKHLLDLSICKFIRTKSKLGGNSKNYSKQVFMQTIHFIRNFSLFFAYVLASLLQLQDQIKMPIATSSKCHYTRHCQLYFKTPDCIKIVFTVNRRNFFRMKPFSSVPKSPPK